MLAEQAPILPNEAEIRKDLIYMTARWHELAEPCVFEIRAFKEGSQPQIAKFSPDWLDEAVDWIEDLNGRGYNIYSVRNPIRHDVSGSAKDDDIVAAFFVWADCDDPASAGNVYRFDGPKWSAAVTTGKTPSIRVHTYWMLEEPCRDMAAWRDMQVTISRHFGSDKAVINPSRIMRVGGTVSYPDSKKQARGYIKELTTLRTEYDEDRPRVTLDQMRRVFGKSAESQSFDFAASEYAPPLDRERTRIAALSGQDWHNAVIRLVASYVGKGLSDDEIHGLTDPLTLAGYTVDQTRREVQTAIDGARAKGWTPEQSFDAPATVPVPQVAPFEPWSEINPLAIPRRDFVYGKHYIRKFASVTVAPGGLGKSTLVLAECIAIATGKEILGIVPKSRERVVYFNAEDPKDEINRRVLAMCQHHGIKQSEIAGWLYTASGRDSELILAVGDNGDIVEPVFELIETWAADVRPGVIALDPLANMTESPETNDVFRRLGKRLSRLADKLNCSVELVHHTRKLNGKEAEIEDSRGGGALLGAVRAGRVLNPMTADEATKAGLYTHIDHFRIEAAGKNNLARPSSHAEWFRRVDVEIPNGDHVAAIETWQWPDAFEGVSHEDAIRVQDRVGAQEPPAKASIQAKNWVGVVVAEALGLDASDKADKARINTMLKKWIAEDVLAIEHVYSGEKGRDIPVVVRGRNNLRSQS